MARIEAALQVRAPERIEPALEPPAPLPPAQRRLEIRVGLTLINRLGVITLVIGIGFFFKWAVDNQWIGPARRVELGVLAGFFALAAADYLWRKGQQVFAQGVTGAGAAILYLSTYAAFGFYSLIPQTFAFACMFVATLLTCALALRYNSIAIAALAFFGAYLTPILLTSGEDHPWFLFPYLLILNVGSLALVRIKRWRSLEVLSVSATLILFWGWFSGHFTPEKRLVATLFTLLYYAIFAEVTIWPLFLISEASTLFAIAAIWPRAAGVFFFLELMVAAGALVMANRRRSAAALSVTFAAFWAAYGVWRTPVLTGSLFIGLTCAFLLFFGWNVWWLLVKREIPRLEDMLLLALNGAAYFGASYALLNPRYHAWIGLLAVAIAAAHLAFAAELWKRRGADIRPALLSAGIALAFLTLAIPIQFSQYHITMAWSLEAAAVTWIAARVQNKRMLVAAVLIFALVACRLAWIDSWIFGVWNARFLTFCIAALSAWFSAWWAEWKEIALLDYIAGHLFMLWGMSLEVIRWAERGTPQSNQLSVKTVSISILFAIYAVILVCIGVGSKTAINRIAGLALIGFVAVKLYLFDVWQLERIYRIAAFVALGALLLATSFLYSHFRRPSR